MAQWLIPDEPNFTNIKVRKQCKDGIQTAHVRKIFSCNIGREENASPCLTISKQALVFTCLQYMSFENTVEKGEIARYEQFFPLSPTMFSAHPENFPPFSSNFSLSSATTFSFEESKICRLGKN